MSTPSEEGIKRLEAEHSPEAIQARLREGPSDSNLRDFIFGAVDGTITTFAVVARRAGNTGARWSRGGTGLHGWSAAQRSCRLDMI